MKGVQTESDPAIQQTGFVELSLPEVKSVPGTDFTTRLVIKAAGNEMGIIISPLFKRNIYADKIDKPAVLLVKVLKNNV